MNEEMAGDGALGDLQTDNGVCATDQVGMRAFVQCLERIYREGTLGN